MLEEQYWIIDSNSINNISSKLYGYIISDNGNFIEDANYNGPTYYAGSFTRIINDNNTILIYLDFYGTYGIYLYQNNDHFIISNEYYNMIKYIVKTYNVKLDINKEYLENYIWAKDMPFSMTDTLISLIQKVKRNAYIEIIDNKLNIIDIDFHESSIKLNTEKAYNIIDKWFIKWCKVFRNLVLKNGYIIFDLSGGFDTRIILAMILYSNIDYKHLYIRSNNPKIAVFLKSTEDYEISHKILDDAELTNRLIFANIKYDDKYGEQYIYYALNTRLSNLNYTCGVSDVLEVYDNKQYLICGVGGEGLHNGKKVKKKHIKHIFEENINLFKKICGHNPNIDISLYITSFNKYLAEVEAKYHHRSDKYWNDMITREYYSSRYNGSKIALSNLNNKIQISPYFDPSICQIDTFSTNDDTLFLLLAIILMRYSKYIKLYNYPVTNKRTLTKNAIQIALERNMEFPIKEHIEFDKLSINKEYELLQGYVCNTYFYNTIKQYIEENIEILQLINPNLVEVSQYEILHTNKIAPYHKDHFVMSSYYLIKLYKLIHKL